jgi:hypothetical protein
VDVEFVLIIIQHRTQLVIRWLINKILKRYITVNTIYNIKYNSLNCDLLKTVKWAGELGGKVAGYRLQNHISLPSRERNFTFCYPFHSGSRPTQSFVCKVLKNYSLWLKQPECEADH